MRACELRRRTIRIDIMIARARNNKWEQLRTLRTVTANHTTENNRKRTENIRSTNTVNPMITNTMKNNREHTRTMRTVTANSTNENNDNN